MRLGVEPAAFSAFHDNAVSVMKGDIHEQFRFTTAAAIGFIAAVRRCCNTDDDDGIGIAGNGSVRRYRRQVHRYERAGLGQAGDGDRCARWPVIA